MNRSNHTGLLLSAVLTALPAFGWISTAHGQFLVGQDGHHNDANNRVGSGGYNNGQNASFNSYSGSNNTNILTGNVSGLNYFHGNTNNIFDPNTVQANTETGASDFLNRIAAPANGQAPNNNGGNYQPYYNAAATVNTPQGFEKTDSSGIGLIPARKTDPLTPDPDNRLGDVNLNNTTKDLLPAPGEVDMAGQVDATGNSSLFTMSPLYGVRKNDMSNANDSFFLSQYSNYRQMTPADRAKLDPTAVRRMQDEINSNPVPPDAQPQGNNQSPGGNGGDGSQPNNGQANTPKAANNGGLNSGDQLSGSALSSGQLSTSSLASPLGAGQFGTDLGSGQSTQNRLIPAGRQSAQLQALEKKFAGQKLTDVQASQLFNQQQHMIQEQSKKDRDKAIDGKDLGAKPDATLTRPFADATPGGTGGGNTGAAGTSGTSSGITVPTKPESPNLPPVLDGNTTPPTAADNQPFVITSLATGIKAKGLADLLKSAEDQMRGGKFSQAITTYDTAQEVAPNNPFVALGRGFAELGRSYYAKADLDISRAINAEPAILAGQYDLKGFIGDERLKFVQDDLVQIAGSEKGARAPVLLAYIAHNTGDDATAAKELDDAAGRGGYTSLVSTMRQAWGLKAATPTAK